MISFITKIQVVLLLNLNKITCAFYGYPFDLLFVFFSHYLLVLLNTYFMETVSSAVSKFTLVNWF